MAGEHIGEEHRAEEHMAIVDRRRFVVSASGALAAGVALPVAGRGTVVPGAGRPALRADPSRFPYQDPELVQGVVGASHANFERVRELVEGYPELAKSSWDWGFGDWESALGAAAHTGRRQIALFLIEHGARPNVFSAAMLGQVDVVRTMVEASPGIQRIPGPHGIPLLNHASAGGDEAADVHEYLLGLGDAGLRPESVPMDADAQAALLGEYRFGPSEDEVIVVTDRRGSLFFERKGQTARGLAHSGDRVFEPAGAPSVRIAFSGPQAATAVTVTYGGDTLRAEREG